MCIKIFNIPSLLIMLFRIRIRITLVQTHDNTVYRCIIKRSETTFQVSASVLLSSEKKPLKSTETRDLVVNHLYSYKFFSTHHLFYELYRICLVGFLKEAWSRWGPVFGLLLPRP